MHPPGSVVDLRKRWLGHEYPSYAEAFFAIRFQLPDRIVGRGDENREFGGPLFRSGLLSPLLVVVEGGKSSNGKGQWEGAMVDGRRVVAAGCKCAIGAQQAPP